MSRQRHKKNQINQVCGLLYQSARLLGDANTISKGSLQWINTIAFFFIFAFATVSRHKRDTNDQQIFKTNNNATINDKDYAICGC